MIVKCSCQHCSEYIEFESYDLAEENSIVPCPHCGLETKLFIPQIPHSPAPIPTQAKLDALAKKNTELKMLEDIVKKYDTSAKIRSNKDELELAVDKVIIRKRGLANALASGMNGDRTIPIASLTAIQLKPAGMITLGYILFSYAGSKPFMGGIWEATQDPDTFLFGRELNEQVTDFKAKVETIMRDSKHFAPPNNTSGTITDELRKLAEFRQQGILSQEEFDAAKKKLLA